MNIPVDKLTIICEMIELLHNSSLLIDDIEDHSELRRGLPAAHTVYGIPLTINCANLAYFLALRKCIELGDPVTVQIFCGKFKLTKKKISLLYLFKKIN